ncbi:class I SAM-dependent methyltransferase [Salinibacter grassmerensis]|uniref:class I SAM-dependent methyltransferase n=1 Tax=Salinibacter grassmerensis TaxID=3040353 RepID=UPI0021E8674B|nr:class I SAM-dependent methyltransferase [Salinibacter grassmerensis]
MSDSPRPSSQPDFWDVRYERERHLFGAEPNAFVQEEVHRLPTGSEVVELGAGEGRTMAWLAQKHGHHVTAVDFSETALATAREWADAPALSFEIVQADVRTWQPDRQWDAAVVTFLQLLPDERQRLYDSLKNIVRPGGWIFAEWFRPTHLTGTYDRMGPSRADRMVPVEEVRRAFADERRASVKAVDAKLREGPHLNGEAAVVRATVRAGAS